VRPERVALLSCETRVPPKPRLDFWALLSGVVRRSQVASGLMPLSVGSWFWLEHPFYVHHKTQYNNSNSVW
jgi:hypothetical protein